MTFHAAHFSLADEARFTSAHRSTALDPSTKLRHMPVSFVSAGCLEGTIKEIASQPAGALPAPPSPLDLATLAQMTLQAPSRSPSVSSLASNASSEEVVVFRGRGSILAASTLAISAVQPSMTTNQPSTAASSLNAPLNAIQPTAPSILPAALTAAPPTKPISTPAPAADETSVLAPDDSDTDSDVSGVNDALFEKRRGDRPIWEGKTVGWVSRSKPGVGWLPPTDQSARNRFGQENDDYRQAAMDDYMQNMSAFGLNDKMAPAFSRREIDLDAGSHNDWEGPDADHDVLRHVDATSAGSRSDGDSDTFLSEGEDEGDLHSNGEDVDEEELDVEDIDDETIARILQKQEELGLGSEELVLHAADEYHGRSQNVTFDFDRPNKKRQHRSGSGYPVASFPSASAMADALDMDPYGAFDIMDTDRPSLRPVKKGRRGQMPPELEDSDLDDTLKATWRADREKKRLKKAEREELRKQGLLGRKGKAPDLSVKYKHGINMMDVMEDIRQFLVSETQTLVLPPMEAYRRAIVHQVVKQLGVNSKSRGDGAGRFTVLSKTRRSAAFDLAKFDEKINQSGFQRRLLNTPAPNRREKKSKGAAKTRSAVGYKDGDVVGASAPELGPENRGHELMKKMGWSKGMALGARNNQGILHPIAHTVKTTKAGLQ